MFLSSWNKEKNIFTAKMDHSGLSMTSFNLLSNKLLLETDPIKVNNCIIFIIVTSLQLKRSCLWVC